MVMEVHLYGTGEQMIFAKKVTDDAGMMWWVFFGKESEESPLMIMSDAQARRFVEEYERELLDSYRADAEDNEQEDE